MTGGITSVVKLIDAIQRVVSVKISVCELNHTHNDGGLIPSLLLAHPVGPTHFTQYKEQSLVVNASQASGLSKYCYHCVSTLGSQ